MLRVPGCITRKPSGPLKPSVRFLAAAQAACLAAVWLFAAGQATAEMQHPAKNGARVSSGRNRSESNGNPAAVPGFSNRQSIVDTLNILQARRVPTDWDKDTQGGFIVSLCFDKRGNVWCGTEDKGLWRCAIVPGQRHWNGVDAQSGLGDNNAYAMACDHQGRMWVGTLNHGVSVFNGEEWRSYGPGEGPIGAHIIAIAVNPVGGDVWMSSDSGLTRYDVAHDTWSHYTRLDGLPDDWATALAFDTKGRLYVGTNADGVAISSPASDYRLWHIVRGPAQMPPTPSGTGLPTSQITALFGTRDGVVYAGTPRGLARTNDGGVHWRYLRGRDWLRHVSALYHGPKARTTDTRGHLLREDYVTALAEDDDGHLLVGYRESGLEIVDERTGYSLGSSDTGTYVRSIISLPSGHVLAGHYADGVGEVDPVTRNDQLDTAHLRKRLSGYPDEPQYGGRIASFPAYAQAPSVAHLNAMLDALRAVPLASSKPAKPLVVSLDDDWLTEGDWLGRYGRYWACLCAICSPNDYPWGAGWEHVDYNSRIGPNHDPDDTLRYWVQWLYTDNPRVLEMPPTYLDSRIKMNLTTMKLNRRQAEQDDHGEAYDHSIDGPHIFFTLNVPSGLHVMSMYEYNKDGHDWEGNRIRDYRISIRQHPDGVPLDNIDSFDKMPELAHGRIYEFWGGVWKRFLVQGPVSLTIKLDRNNSTNAILPAVMLDLVDPDPAPYFHSVAEWKALEAAREKAALEPDPNAAVAASQSQGADLVLAELARVRYRNPSWWAMNNRRFYEPLIRWYRDQARDHPKDTALIAKLGDCCYGAGLYPEWEQCQRDCGLMPARDIEKALRWDGVSAEGQGYEVVTAYLASLKSRSVSVQ